MKIQTEAGLQRKKKQSKCAPKEPQPQIDDADAKEGPTTEEYEALVKKYKQLSCTCNENLVRRLRCARASRPGPNQSRGDGRPSQIPSCHKGKIAGGAKLGEEGTS